MAATRLLRWTTSLLSDSNRTPFPRLRFYSTTISGKEAVAAHPWPEWEGFLEKLRTKGYFDRSSSSTLQTNSDDGGGGRRSSDLNAVKNACLSFARERFDVFSSLPKEDIQSVVESGCPNLFRKAVNSAKRLRAFLKLDEADVCSACNLRGSCDKAYKGANEDGARTVDVMRVLLYQAIDPIVLSGEKNPAVKDTVRMSAQKLLEELTKLIDTDKDPALPKPEAKSFTQKEPSQRFMSKENQSQNVEMKRGDWLCPNCTFLNFAKNLRCLECKADGPKRIDSNKAEMKLGDWTCPGCHFMNFSRNQECLRCQRSRPKRELNPGEWECPSCNFLNFRKNIVCLKCNCNRPKNEFDDNSWAESEVSRKLPTSKFGEVTESKVSRKLRTSKFGDDGDEFPDDADDVLPLHEGENKFVVSNRSTKPERRLTSARNRNYRS